MRVRESKREIVGARKREEARDRESERGREMGKGDCGSEREGG